MKQKMKSWDGTLFGRGAFSIRRYRDDAEAERDVVLLHHLQTRWNRCNPRVHHGADLGLLANRNRILG